MGSNPVKRLLRYVFHLSVSGPLFRVIAPKNHSAAPAQRHKLAIVDQIPYFGDKVMIFPLIENNWLPFAAVLDASWAMTPAHLTRRWGMWSPDRYRQFVRERRFAKP